MKRFETVFLDAGGVLVWPNWSRVADALSAHGVPADAKKLEAADPLARYELDRAHVVDASTDQRRSRSFFDLVFEEAGIEVSDRTAAAMQDVLAYHKVHNLWENVPDFVKPALRELRADGYKLAVVSNANGTVQKLFERVGLAPLVDMIFDSQIEGMEKPDPRFFELAITRSGARAHATVHVGDFYNIDVVGARRASLLPVLVDEIDLRRDADCARIRSIAELPERLRNL
ncbi:MAG TPA: HAD family hydrolase [Thermoanaerobaculia bacterium]|nr:HAD family hydrolase [Thermoanaerobaculia bacterium]